MKRILLLLISLVMCVGLAGCKRLSGVNLELQVIGVNSLPGVDYVRENEALPLETDSYGRQLFAFSSPRGGGLLTLLVSQKTTERRSYYYDNINYISCRPEEEGLRTSNLSEELAYRSFSKEQIDLLKSENDWEKPLDKEKFFEVKVESINLKDASDKEHLKALSELGDNPKPISSLIMTTDKNGTFLVCLVGEAGSVGRRTIAAYDCWGNYVGEGGIIDITDSLDYQEDIVRLKEAIGWCSFPFAKK